MKKLRKLDFALIKRKILKKVEREKKRGTRLFYIQVKKDIRNLRQVYSIYRGDQIVHS
jgi:hypothetical protein